MTDASDNPTKTHCSHDDDITLISLMLMLARRWQLIASLTVIAAVVSTGVAMSKPTVYASNAKLLVLEFIDQTDVLRVGNDGKLVRGELKGVWKPADASAIKGVLESTHLKQFVGSKLGGNQQHNVQIKQEKQPSVITVRVEGKNREATAQIATATVEEAARLAFRMGLLASPTLALDEIPKKNDGAAMVVRLLEPPTIGSQVKPKRTMIILLSTVTGLFCSIFLAIVLEYFRNLSDEDRIRLGEIKAAFKCRSADNTAPDKE
jgi:uncharacterized protein involved in exopolysaccharide biosynthesis